MRRRNKFFSAPKKRSGGIRGASHYGPGSARPKRRGQYIDPAKFVNAAVAEKLEAPFTPKHAFTDFGLSQPVYQNLTAKGYKQPTPVQDDAIKPVLAGRDLIGLANTGTGKTAAFALPMIERLKNDIPGKTALIIAPTRELAVQINDEFKAFARGIGLYSTLCLGGVGIGGQINELRRNPRVVIGTPGRLKDLYNQGYLKLDRVGILVLDEADRMLDMGFIVDIRFIISKLPQERQSLCFSATMPNEIRSLVNHILKNPVTVSVRTSETHEHVEQNVIKAGSKDEKIRILKELLSKQEFSKVLIFGATKWSVQRLANDLSKYGHSSEAIHGNKSQPQRQRALKAFKDGRVKILVATDVASRGLDIPAVSHVINFDQPTTYEDYIHRIGRTGRAGARGVALTFVV